MPKVLLLHLVLQVCVVWTAVGDTSTRCITGAYHKLATIATLLCSPVPTFTLHDLSGSSGASTPTQARPQQPSGFSLNVSSSGTSTPNPPRSIQGFPLTIPSHSNTTSGASSPAPVRAQDLPHGEQKSSDLATYALSNVSSSKSGMLHAAYMCVCMCVCAHYYGCLRAATGATTPHDLPSQALADASSVSRTPSRASTVPVSIPQATTSFPVTDLPSSGASSPSYDDVVQGTLERGLSLAHRHGIPGAGAACIVLWHPTHHHHHGAAACIVGKRQSLLVEMAVSVNVYKHTHATLPKSLSSLPYAVVCTLHTQPWYPMTWPYQ